MRIVVIGGGIAGLAAAWQLAEQRPDDTIEVLEASDRVGGKLRLDPIAGRPVDVGAEAMLARRPEGIALASAVALGSDLIHPLTTSARLRVGGATHPLPTGTIMGIPSDLAAARASGALTDDALRRIAAEPGQAPLAPLESDTAVGTLVRDRLGDEIADRLVDPLLGGVYAGRADGLSLRATIPALAARLRNGGSLVQAAASLVPVAAGTAQPKPAPVFASLAGGLGRLPVALAGSGRFAVRVGVTVRRLTRRETGFVLDCGPVPKPEFIEADAVVVAVPASKASALLGEVAPAASIELATVTSASMAIVTAAYAGVELPPGSGLLVGSSEGFSIKAVTLSSQKWPGFPAGQVVLRASIGRAGESRELQRDDRELVELVQAELRELIGVSATPIDTMVTRWGGGLPQYAPGHVDLVTRVRESVATVPGLAVCGASYDGVGIPACIASASAAVERIVDDLRARQLAVEGRGGE